MHRAERTEEIPHADALSLNLLGITKLKVANFLPALLMVPLFFYLWQFVPLAGG